VMSVVQPQRLSRSFAIDQPFRSIGVELHHPSRTTCNPTPPIFAASVRVAPS
jgi:hypothetical protein